MTALFLITLIAGMTRLKSYFNKHLSALLVLLMLSASVLSSSHVHAEDYLALDLDSDHIEQCLAYHVADHQQFSHIPSFDFGEDASYRYQISAQHTSKQHQNITPPARAPPKNV